MTDSGQRNFSSDVLWNIAGLAIAGIAGILLNYLISFHYGAATLGVFNQVFAGYILFSQLAALGVHLSALQGIATAATHEERQEVAVSAFAVTAVLAVASALLFYLAASFIADLVDSQGVAVGIELAAPGLLFFALCKVSFACANGARRMRWYAILTATRFLMMLVAYGVSVVLDVDGERLPVILTVAEMSTFLLSVVAVRDLLCWPELRRMLDRARQHLVFGTKGVMSGVLADLNTRVDVLMLGYFTTDTIVGAYSFAAILAEGFVQLIVVVRNNYAPIVARALALGKTEEVNQLARRARNRTLLAAIPIAAIAVGGYAIVIPIVTTSPAMAASWQYFAILLAGMAVTSGYMIFGQVLLHGRLPGWHSLFMGAVVLSNVVANAVLIPYWSAVGAAVATSIAALFAALLTRLMAHRLLSIRI